MDKVRPEGSKGGWARDSGVSGRRVCSRVFRTRQHGGQCGWRGAGVRSRVGDGLSGNPGPGTGGPPGSCLEIDEGVGSS